MIEDTSMYEEIDHLNHCAQKLEETTILTAQELTKELSERDGCDVAVQALASALVVTMIRRFMLEQGRPPTSDELFEGIVGAPWRFVSDIKLAHHARENPSSEPPTPVPAEMPELEGEALRDAAFMLRLQASTAALSAVLSIDTLIRDPAISLKALSEGTAQALVRLAGLRVFDERKREADPEELERAIRSFPWASLIADLTAQRAAATEINKTLGKN